MQTFNADGDPGAVSSHYLSSEEIESTLERDDIAAGMEDIKAGRLTSWRDVKSHR